jgi:succinate-semialdehyde dehydrogenase/glutarate-semialdehyde dehydrogenase
MLGINTTMIAGADAPFGGVKWSGHGPRGWTGGAAARASMLKTVHEG